MQLLLTMGCYGRHIVPARVLMLMCCGAQIEVREGQTVRWLTVGMGTENDMHTPIFFNQVRAHLGVVVALIADHDRLRHPACSRSRAPLDRPGHVAAAVLPEHATVSSCGLFVVSSLNAGVNAE